MITNALILALILLVFLSTFFIIMYNKEKKKYNELFSKVNKTITEIDKPLRCGFYKMNCTQNDSITYEPIVFVKEIDRYTNGKSKLKIDRIEISCGDRNFGYGSAENFVKKEFKSLVETSDITWLESEIEIKEQRRNKLAHLKEVITDLK